MSPHDRDQLERLIHQTLRGQPDREAPSTLETRVLAELQRRESESAGRREDPPAGPWWKRSYTYWPAPARLGFAAILVMAAAAVLTAASFLGRDAENAPLVGALRTRFAGLLLARQIFDTVGGKGSLIVRAVPPVWLYGVGGSIAACYAGLTGLGVIAYRILSSRHRAP